MTKLGVLYDTEFVVPFSSRSQVIKSSSFLSEDIIISLKLWFFFERKNVSFDDFFMTIWEQEEKGPQIPRVKPLFKICKNSFLCIS